VFVILNGSAIFMNSANFVLAFLLSSMCTATTFAPLPIYVNPPPAVNPARIPHASIKASTPVLIAIESTIGSSVNVTGIFSINADRVVEIINIVIPNATRFSPMFLTIEFAIISVIPYFFRELLSRNIAIKNNGNL